MSPNEIEKTYTHTKRLPPAIVQLCDYLKQFGYPISGCFELSSIGMNDLTAWFPRKPQVLDDLMPFGRGACGDVYSLWLTHEPDPENAPVVIFGSEGELKALASNAIEFCRLLCFGYSELGLENHQGLGDDYQETQKFRTFINKIYHFELPDSGDEIINQANQDYPEFKQWVEQYAW